MAEIVLDGLGKRFADGTAAVRDVSCTIGDGELFVLVGPSGCGKSTLLQLIVGLERPTAGEIRLDGRRIDDLDPKDRDMAMVFQSYALYPHMTVRENLAFPLRLAKVARAERERRIEETAALLELGELLDRKPAKLSGGQRQRVAMGRAIVRRPAVFLLDEPLSNLDARLRVQMRGEIARLQRRLGVTMIYVTHDQSEAMILGDRVAVLRAGGVEQIGTPRELYDRPRSLFVASFLGSPSINLFPARVGERGLLLPFGEETLPLPSGAPECSGHPLVAGLRPEKLRVGCGSPSDPCFRGQVELVEWLGAELYLHVAVPFPSWVEPGSGTAPWRQREDKLIVVARADPSSNLAVGDQVDLSFSPNALHIFVGPE